jgi:hypothetical protein
MHLESQFSTGFTMFFPLFSSRLDRDQMKVLKRTEGQVELKIFINF